MSKQYCRECAKKLGYIQFVDPVTDFSGSVGSYKFKKYQKHTTIPANTSSGIISVFQPSDYETYKSYSINAAKSGSVELDDNGRINLIWFANKETGESYQDGQFIANTDGVKLVLHSDEEYIHTFPTSSLDFFNNICAECSKSISV